MKKETVGTFAILLATFFWGITFVLIKDAVSVLDVFTFLFWRFGVASLLLFLFFFPTLRKIDASLLAHGLILGLLLGGTVVFQSIGLQYTSASHASFITGLSVVFVVFFTSLLQKYFPPLRVVVGVLLAMFGLALVTLHADFSVNIGDFWVLLCAFCFAGYIILAGKYTHLHGALPLTIVQIVTIALLSGFISLFTGSFVVPHGYLVWQAIIFCAVFASVLAFSLQIHFQKYVSPTKTAIIFVTEPLFATITAVIYAGEELSLSFIFGATLIFLAMLLTQLPLKKGKSFK